LIFNNLLNGTIDDWERLTKQFPDFPCCGYGITFPDYEALWYWINEAIACCSFDAVEWIISKGINLNFMDAEGYTPLFCCIEREFPDKYDMLQLLIDNGADVNFGAHWDNNTLSFNGWAPLNLAAARGNLKAVKILLDNGADPTLRTTLDCCYTAEEEADFFGHKEVAEFLRTYKKIK
jgi:ankyrin repeat protein